MAIEGVSDGSVPSAARQGAPRPALVLAVSVLAAALDGFDVQAMAFVAPGLARQWGIGLPAFGAVFSLGLLGLIVGGLVLAPLGDRIGRKRLILLSGIGVGVATIATAAATNIPELVVLRFVTGIFLGAMMPGLVTIAHEAPPPHRRTLYVTILMCGFPMGGFFGGMIAAWSLPRHGWEALLIGMGTLALVIVLLLAAVLDRQPPAPVARPVRRLPSGDTLLRDGRAPVTLTLWLLFFATLLNVYLLASWLPALLERDGFTTAQAAIAAGICNLGGAAGGLLIGYFVARHGERVLAAAFLLGAIGVAAFGFVGGSLAAMIGVAFVVGLIIPGGQVCNNAIAAARYPAAMRATGIGWAQGIGRVGSVIGPALVALALELGFSNRSIFAAAALLAILGAFAAFTISRFDPPAEEPA